MKKKIVCFVLSVCVSLLSAAPVIASSFDATYYAAKYPDVVAQFGTTNAEVLENHYNLIGKNEGRYPNATEELLANQPVVPQITSPTVQTTPAVEAKPEKKSTQVTYITWDDTITPSIPTKLTTYVDVDIANQTVTYFENGKSVFTTPCVTGNPNNGYATPTGTYKILTHTNGKRLKGKTWDVWVNKWMRFTEDSCGLHDASWRKSFGGNIYKTNGSHGCVNLPKDAAYLLFDKVSVGTSVIVH